MATVVGIYWLTAACPQREHAGKKSSVSPPGGGDSNANWLSPACPHREHAGKKSSVSPPGGGENLVSVSWPRREYFQKDPPPRTLPPLGSCSRTGGGHEEKGGFLYLVPSYTTREARPPNTPCLSGRSYTKPAKRGCRSRSERWGVWGCPCPPCLSI